MIIYLLIFQLIENVVTDPGSFVYTSDLKKRKNLKDYKAISFLF